MTNEQMHKAFEAAMARQFGCAEGDFQRDAEGCYANRSWRDAFIGWKAGYAAANEPRSEYLPHRAGASV